MPQFKLEIDISHNDHSFVRTADAQVISALD